MTKPINYLKALQKMAREDNGLIDFTYHNKKWAGTFYFGNTNRAWIEIKHTNFNTMLKKLYGEIKK